MLTYRVCRHWEDREETEWRIESDALVRRDVSGQERRWPWKDIAVVWPHWKRKDRVGPYHTTSVWLAGQEGDRCDFESTHVVTAGEYEQRVDEYNAFLAAVLTNIVAKSPGAKGRLGEHPMAFAWLVVLLAFLVLVAIWWQFEPDRSWVAKIALPVVAIFGARQLYRGRPRSMPVGQLMQELKL